MSLKERITSEIKTAMKSGDRNTVSVLRMVNAKILEKEVELRSKKGRDYQLNDEEAVGVILTYAKQRRQSIDSYREGGREDLAAQEEAELLILQQYLPKQLSEEEVEAMVEQAISETGASGPQDMGRVMKALMPKVKGAVDGKLLSEMVQRKLAAG